MVAMNLAVRKPMSLAEFLEWEERQELRYEFDGVEPSAMTGGSGCSCHYSAQPSDSYWGKAQGQALPAFMEAISKFASLTITFATRTELVCVLARRSSRQGRS